MEQNFNEELVNPNKNQGKFFGVFFANMFTLSLMFVSGILVMRTLGPAESGRFISIYVIPGLLIRFALLGTRQSTIFHLGKNKFNESKVVSALIYLWLFSSIMALIINSINYHFLHRFHLSFQLHLLVLSAIPMRLFIVYCIGIFFGKRKFFFSNLFTFLPEFINFLVILYLILFHNINVHDAIMAYFISSLLVSVLCLVVLKRMVSFNLEYNWAVIKAVAVLGLLNATALFIMQLNYKIDLLFMYKYTTHYEVGIYALGVGIAAIIWQIPDTIGLLVQSAVSNTKDYLILKHGISSVLRVAMAFAVVISILIYFGSPFLIKLVYGKAFLPSVYIVRAILPGVFTFVIYRTISGVFSGLGKPQILIAIFIPALVLNILLNIFLIPMYHGIGAAWASNISYTAGAIATLVVFSRKMNLSLVEVFHYKVSDFKFLKRYVPFRRYKKN